MPATRTNKKKLPYAADAIESAGRGVGSARRDRDLELPTLITTRDTLAQNMPDPEIDGSAHQPTDTSMEYQDEEDIILLADPTTRNMDTTTGEEEEETLLSLRKRYKRTLANLMRVGSHMDFVVECQRKKLTPRGLRINVRCNALLANQTTVSHRFKEITGKTESDYLKALAEHYLTSTKNLEKEKNDLEAAMEAACRGARDRKTVDLHRELLQKTIANMDTKEKALDLKKKKKLDGLRAPPPPKTKEPRRQGRGMSRNNRKPPNHQRSRRAPPPNNRPRDNNDTTPRPANNTVHVNPNFAPLNQSPQVTALLAGLYSHLSSPNPYVQQPPPLYGQATYAPCLQQPPLYGRGLPGWQQPSLSFPGTNGGPPQQQPGNNNNQNFY